jgi:hypothetical protein
VELNFPSFYFVYFYEENRFISYAGLNSARTELQVLLNLHIYEIRYFIPHCNSLLFPSLTRHFPRHIKLSFPSPSSPFNLLSSLPPLLPATYTSPSAPPFHLLSLSSPFQHLSLLSISISFPPFSQSVRNAPGSL